MDEQQSSIPEILTNKNEAPLALPLLPKDDYVLKVKEVKLVQGNKGQLIKITLNTTQDVRDVLGKQTLKAGFPVFDQISLTPTENYPQENIQRRLKQFRAAVTGDKSNAPFFPLQQYEGGTVRASLKIQEAKDGFEEKNSVSKYILPKGD